MEHLLLLAGDSTIWFVLSKSTVVGKVIMGVLLLFSMCAWGVMAFKASQMSRARKFNNFFENEFHAQETVAAMHERRVEAEGCPMFNVYQDGCMALDKRLKEKNGERRRFVSLKSMEHIKGVIEAAVAREAVRLEGGLILLAIAVSGAPFIGLLGTVWGVMDVFHIAGMPGSSAALTDVAPGVAAALATTVAGLLVAIPSMFGYNWLVHNLRVHNVELDNFAQEFAANIEGEYLLEDTGSALLTKPEPVRDPDETQVKDPELEPELG